MAADDGHGLARAGQPVAKLGLVHRGAEPLGLRVHRRDQVTDGREVTSQPRLLGARGRDRAGPLQLIGVHRHLPGRFQQAGRAGLAAPGRDPAEQHQRGASRVRVRVQDQFGPADGLVPAPARELQPGPLAPHVVEEADEFSPLGQLHARGQVALGLVEPEVGEQMPGDVDVSPAGILGVARVQGYAQSLVDGGLARSSPRASIAPCRCWSGRARWSPGRSLRGPGRRRAPRNGCSRGRGWPA